MHVNKKIASRTVKHHDRKEHVTRIGCAHTDCLLARSANKHVASCVHHNPWSISTRRKTRSMPHCLSEAMDPYKYTTRPVMGWRPRPIVQMICLPMRFQNADRPGTTRKRSITYLCKDIRNTCSSGAASFELDALLAGPFTFCTSIFSAKAIDCAMAFS